MKKFGEYMKKEMITLFMCFSIAAFSGSGCSEVKNNNGVQTGEEKKNLIVAAEDSIPGVPPNILSADYWMEQIPNPDDTLMTAEEIVNFNEESPVKGTYLIDVMKLPQKADGNSIKKYLSGNSRFLETASFFITGDVPLEKSERAKIIALIDTTGIPDTIELKFAVTLSPVMGRSWPTYIPL